MKSKSSQVTQTKSEINYSYKTIKITQSRISKGLIAIPVALAKWFPEHNDTIQIYLNDSPVSQTKHYSSYDSSTRECRIGGMKHWFQQNNIRSGDEIVIQIMDKEHFIYGLIPERNFIVKTKELQNSFDNSETDQEASEQITTLVEWTDVDKQRVVLSEYHRLVNTLSVQERRYVKKHSNQAREGVPSNLRVLVGDIYQGHCQVCDFWFLKKDQTPYFETHHINPLQGNNPKNLVLVCANCHRQFEYTDVHHEFNDDGWLVKVSFNNRIYSLNQIHLKTKLDDSFKELFI